MELVYIALFLHKLGKEINEENIKKVLNAVGGTPNEAKIKTLIASLKGIDIEKELETATIAAAAPVAGGNVGKPAEKKEEKVEEAAEGLSSLFG